MINRRNYQSKMKWSLIQNEFFQKFKILSIFYNSIYFWYHIVFLIF
jgi:hypothetical protein